MEHVLIPVITLTGVLIMGAVTGILHGGRANQIGDRVACGLIALPLISFLAGAALPNMAAARWLVPAPLAVYLLLLALVEPPNENPRHTNRIRRFVETHFTWTLIVMAAVLYTIAAIA